MPRATRFLTLFLATGLWACDGSSSLSTALETDPPGSASVAQAQVLHASPDAPPVIIAFNGIEQADPIDYQGGSRVINLTGGDNEVRVDGVLPSGQATVIGPVTLNFAEDTLYRIVAVDDVANIAPLVLEQPATDVPTGSARLRVLHAAPLAPTVDVYLTAPGADLAASAPAGTFTFMDSSDVIEVAAGDYQVRVTGTGSTVPIFDSGTITLYSGSDLLVAATENTMIGASPINLTILPAAQTGATTLYDAATPANLRAVHDAADAPAVDVVANDQFAAPLVSNLQFPDFTDYLGVAPDTYNVKVVPTGTQNAVIDADLTLLIGESYSVLAVGSLAAGIEALVVEDDPRPIATQAKLRVIHGSASAGDVDIYLTAVGADIENESPVLSGVPFKADSGYLPVAEGDYDVTVTPAGSKTAAIGPATVSLANGGVYTAVARDAAGGGTPLGLILMDDFAP